MKQRKNLYLFFKEVVNNAVKYSDAETIAVNIEKKDHQIEMTIADNGKGFDITTASSGNGLNSLKKRAEELHAIYTIHSQVAMGTTVRLKFNIG
jgi:signal transduction histidine kinase